MDRGDRILAWFFTVTVLGIALVAIVSSLPSEDSELTTYVQYSEIYRNIGFVVGGIAAFVLALWRIYILDQQTKISERDLKQKEQDSEQDAIQRTRDLKQKEDEHAEDRFERAVGFLESENELARVAGIASLRKIAATRPDPFVDRGIQLLCSFLRQHRKASEGESPASTEFEEAFATIADLIRRSPKRDQRALWRIVDLRGVSFDNISLNGWQVGYFDYRKSSFRNTRFNDCRISVYFSADNEFRNAVFTNCRFSGYFADVDFRRAEFNGCTFEHVNFAGCNFENADFCGSRFAEVTPMYSIFQDCFVANTKFAADPNQGDRKYISHEGLTASQFAPLHFSGSWIARNDQMPDDLDFNQPRLKAVFQETGRLASALLAKDPANSERLYVVFEEVVDGDAA